MWKSEKDGSVLDAMGNVVVFSPERFMKDIIAGDACFLCGVHPKDRPFNNLLVLPEWLLRRYDLAQKTVRTAQGTTVRYDQNTVPCCQSCNILVNDEIERPVAEVVARGGDSINDYIRDHGVAKIYIWLALTFVKTHLKDNLARYRLEPPESTVPIAHEWSKLHFVHSVVRGHLANAEVNIEVTGSLLTLPVNKASVAGPFDYADLFAPQTAMVRFESVAVVAVFDDTGAALNYYGSTLEKITGGLSGVQIREVMVELAYINTRLTDRPTYKTSADLAAEKLQLIGIRPQLAIKDGDLALRGKLLRSALGSSVERIEMAGKTADEVSEAVDAGTLTLMFDNDGRFIENSQRPA